MSSAINTLREVTNELELSVWWQSFMAMSYIYSCKHIMYISLTCINLVALEYFPLSKCSCMMSLEFIKCMIIGQLLVVLCCNHPLTFFFCFMTHAWWVLDAIITACNNACRDQPAYTTCSSFLWWVCNTNVHVTPITCKQ